MSKALPAEAQSAKHLAAHYPSNPWCKICMLAHFRQQRHARKGEHQDDELDKITMPMQELFCDSIVSKPKGDVTKLSSSGCLSVQVMRDTFSDAALSSLERGRAMETNIKNFKFFAGPRYSSPHIFVKSDADKSQVPLSTLNGIPSLENTWPHNTVHERHQGKFKGVQRAPMLQSGIPESGRDVAATYPSIVVTVVEPTPILPYERIAAGQVLEAHVQKSEQNCWECFHRGVELGSPIQPFGRL